MAHEPHCRGRSAAAGPSGREHQARRGRWPRRRRPHHRAGPPDRRGDDDRQAETGQAEAVSTMYRVQSASAGADASSAAPDHTGHAQPQRRTRPVPIAGGKRRWARAAEPCTSAVGGGGTAGPAGRARAALGRARRAERRAPRAGVRAAMIPEATRDVAGHLGARPPPRSSCQPLARLWPRHD